MCRSFPLWANLMFLPFAIALLPLKPLLKHPAINVWDTSTLSYCSAAIPHYKKSVLRDQSMQSQMTRNSKDDANDESATEDSYVYPPDDVVDINLGGTSEPIMVFPLKEQLNDQAYTHQWKLRTDEVPEREIQEAQNFPVSSDDDVIDPTSSSLGLFGLDGLPMALAPASGISYFYLHKTLGLSEDVMWKITLEAGTVLGFSVKNLELKVSLLRRTMNLSDEDVRTILTKHPTILHMSANKNLAPTILFLVRALDLSKRELRKMIVQYPCILCYSMGKWLLFNE